MSTFEPMSILALLKSLERPREQKSFEDDWKAKVNSNSPCEAVEHSPPPRSDSVLRAGNGIALYSQMIPNSWSGLQMWFSMSITSTRQPLSVAVPRMEKRRPF